MKRPRTEFAQRLAALLALAVLVLAPLAGTVAAGPNVRPPYALSDSLVAYWKLDEASGTRLDELSGCGGSGCDLTDNNTVTSAAGVVGDAAQFTAANSEWLSHADNADFSMGGDTSFTLAAWVYLDDLDDFQGIISKGGGSEPNTEYWLDYQSGRFRFGISDGTLLSGLSATTADAPTAGVWYFVVGWYDSLSSTVNISVNGVSDSAGDVGTGGAQDLTNALNLGDDFSGFSFTDGRIDEAAIWKRVLTAGERTLLYNGGAGCTYPFTACEGTPTATATATSTATTFTATPTDTPTVTTTPLPTDTATPTATFTPTPTATPLYDTDVELSTSQHVLVTARWELGDLMTFLAVLLLVAVTIMRFLWELAREAR